MVMLRKVWKENEHVRSSSRSTVREEGTVSLEAWRSEYSNKQSPGSIFPVPFQQNLLVQGNTMNPGLI